MEIRRPPVFYTPSIFPYRRTAAIGCWGKTTRILDPWENSFKTVSFQQAFDESIDTDGAAISTAAQRMYSGLLAGQNVAANVQTALAIPDTLDEMAQRFLRAALAARQGKSWFVWRSVAGALGWQRSGAFETSGDP